MKLCRQVSHTFHAGLCMQNLPSCCKALVHHMLHDSVRNPIVQLASGCCMEICTQILMFWHAGFCCDITIRAAVWRVDWSDALLPLIQPRTSWELRDSGQFGDYEMKKLCSRESPSGGDSFEGHRTPHSQATTRYLASFSMVDTPKRARVGSMSYSCPPAHGELGLGRDFHTFWSAIRCVPF
jgi:hypothetical protein